MDNTYTQLVFSGSSIGDFFIQLNKIISFEEFFYRFYYYMHVSPVAAFLSIFLIAHLFFISSKTSKDPQYFTKLVAACLCLVYLGWFCVGNYLPPRYFCYLVFFVCLGLLRNAADKSAETRFDLFPYFITLLAILISNFYYPQSQKTANPETFQEFQFFSISFGRINCFRNAHAILDGGPTFFLFQLLV